MWGHLRDAHRSGMRYADAARLRRIADPAIMAFERFGWRGGDALGKRSLGGRLALDGTWHGQILN